MKFDHHPNYVESVTKRLSSIELKFKERVRPGGKVYEGPPPVAEFFLKDLREVREFETDVSRRRISIGKPEGDGFLTIEGEGFKSLQKLASDLLVKCGLTEVISQERLEDFLFDYRIATHQAIEQQTLIDYLASRIANAIKSCKFDFPLSGAQGDVRFSFCGVEFRPRSKIYGELLAAFAETGEEKPGEKDMWEHQREQWVDGYGKCMWASVEVWAEPQLASEVALRRVQDATHLIRALCAQGYVPAQHVGLIPGATFSEPFLMVKMVDQTLGFSSRSASKDELLWFGSNLVNTLGQIGLRSIDSLYSKESRTELEDLCLRALIILGSAAGMRDISDKIVFGCTALDLLFTRGKDEPILATMPKRFAMEIGKDLEERKSIVQVVKYVYGLRSGRVHAGRSAESTEEVVDFFRYLFYLAPQLIPIAGKYKTHKEYLDSIDDRQLSG